MPCQAAENALKIYKKAKAEQFGIQEANIEDLTTLDDDAIYQEIETLKQTDEFLSLINLIPKDSVLKETLGVGTGCVIASRSDTNAGQRRQALSVTSGEVMRVDCENVNFDTFVSFDQLDTHARTDHFADLLERDSNYQMAQDVSRIGFHGKIARKQTDRNQNPNGEDVLPGWFQAIREYNPDAMLTSADIDPSVIVEGNYLNVEHVARVLKSKIAPHYRYSNDLVMLIGSDLVDHSGKSYRPITLNTNGMTKKSILKQVDGSFASLPSFTPSNFPAKGMLITSFDNLSVYFLLGSLRCAVGIVNSGEDRIENRKSLKLAYGIEQLSKAAALDYENVSFSQYSFDNEK